MLKLIPHPNSLQKFDSPFPQDFLVLLVHRDRRVLMVEKVEREGDFVGFVRFESEREAAEHLRELPSVPKDLVVDSKGFGILHFNLSDSLSLRKNQLREIGGWRRLRWRRI